MEEGKGEKAPVKKEKDAVAERRKLEELKVRLCVCVLQ